MKTKVLTFSLPAIAPFRLDLTVWALRRRDRNIIDYWNGTHFKGIGRWSAEYVLLRGLGRVDILPGDDVAVQKNIKRIFNLHKKPDYNKIKEIEKKWHPYAGIVYFHLLLQKLSENDIF